MNTALPHTNVLDSAETEAYKRQAVTSKFKQQMSYGVGAAMVFGLVSALGKAMVDLVGTTGAASFMGASVGISTLATAGLIGLGVLGIGCLFLSARYLSENTVLDQALQAKQLAKAQSVGIAITPVHQTAKAHSFPGQAMEKAETPAIIAEHAASDKPGKVISDAVMFDRLESAQKSAAAAR